MDFAIFYTIFHSCLIVVKGTFPQYPSRSPSKGKLEMTAVAGPAFKTAWASETTADFVQAGIQFLSLGKVYTFHEG